MATMTMRSASVEQCRRRVREFLLAVRAVELIDVVVQVHSAPGTRTRRYKNSVGTLAPPSRKNGP